MEMHDHELPHGVKPLVVIIAYEAEYHLPELISRLARVTQVRDYWSVLLLDDTSCDRTSELAQKLLAEYGFSSWLVVRNEQNQGYGGNQKVGYRYALQRDNYTHVALLHGDCQYPPEALPAMLAQALDVRADVVLASRMWSVMSARRGGMPLYKMVGNRLLTWAQNRLTGQALSEYHTGQRLYSTELLARIPYDLNSDGFDFDTEILLQAFYVGAKVAEIPISTRYAGEVSRVPGIQYAVNIMRASFDYWLQMHGMGCSLRFRDLLGKRNLYLDKTHLEGSTHDVAVRFLLKQQARSVLDLGCGPGHVGSIVKAELPAVRYCGADLVSDPPDSCDEYWQCNLDRTLPPTNPFDYDAVLCLDVLEHLSEPEQFLLRLRQSHLGNQKTFFVFSTANVAFLSIRLGLLLGRFEYGDRGILDITHRRLMTKASFIRLIRETGFVIERVEGIAVPFQLVFGDNWWTRLAAKTWRSLTKLLPGLLSFQFLIIARAKRAIPDISSSFNKESHKGIRDIQ